MSRDGQDLLRKALLEQQDGMEFQYRSWIPALRTTPIEILKAPVESTWGSIFGILDHMIADQRITISILEQSGHGDESMEAFAGNSQTVEELIEKQLEADRRFVQLLRECDLLELRYFLFPDRQHWRRSRVYTWIQIQFEHSLQHRGGVDQLLRERNIKLMANPLLEYVMAAPTGSVLREDTLVVSSSTNDYPSLDAARRGTD